MRLNGSFFALVLPTAFHTHKSTPEFCLTTQRLLAAGGGGNPPPPRDQEFIVRKHEILQKEILIWAVFGTQTFGLLGSRIPPPPEGELCPAPVPPPPNRLGCRSHRPLTRAQAPPPPPPRVPAAALVPPCEVPASPAEARSGSARFHRPSARPQGLRPHRSPGRRTATQSQGFMGSGGGPRARGRGR